MMKNRLIHVLIACMAVALTRQSAASHRIFDPQDYVVYDSQGNQLPVVPKGGRTFPSGASEDWKAIQNAIWEMEDYNEGEIHIKQKQLGSQGGFERVPWQVNMPLQVIGELVPNTNDMIVRTGYKIVGSANYSIEYTGTAANRACFEFENTQEFAVEGLGIRLLGSNKIGFKFGENVRQAVISRCNVETRDVGSNPSSGNIGFLVGLSLASGGSNDNSDLDFINCTVRYVGNSDLNPESTPAQSITTWSRGHVGFCTIGQNTLANSFTNCTAYMCKFGFTNVDTLGIGPSLSNSHAADYVNCDGEYCGVSFFFYPGATPNIMGGRHEHSGMLLVYGVPGTPQATKGIVSITGVHFDAAQNSLNSQITYNGSPIALNGNIISYSGIGALSLRNCSFSGQAYDAQDGVGKFMRILGTTDTGMRRISYEGVTMVGDATHFGFWDDWSTSACWGAYIEGNSPSNLWKICDTADLTYVVAQ